jgi:hypothetical protein
MQAFHLTAVAPQAAHYAAVRVARPANNYDPVVLDDLVRMPVHKSRAGLPTDHAEPGRMERVKRRRDRAPGCGQSVARVR